MRLKAMRLKAKCDAHEANKSKPLISRMVRFFTKEDREVPGADDRSTDLADDDDKITDLEVTGQEITVYSSPSSSSSSKSKKKKWKRAV